CFTQGRWEAGLANLLASNDATLKAVAAADAEATAGKGAEAKAADRWWDYAAAAPEAEKRAAETRARFSCLKAVPPLAGRAKARAETRLAFTMNNVEYGPGLVAEFNSLQMAVFGGKRGRIDNTLDFNAGDFAGGRPVAITVRWTALLVPPTP